MISEIGLDPFYYDGEGSSSAVGALREALVQLHPSLGTGEMMAMGDGPFFGQLGTTPNAIRSAMGRLRSQVEVLGRPLYPSGPAGSHRVRGLARRFGSAHPAFLQARLSDVVIQHSLGGGHAPVPGYGPRALLQVPTAYGEGGVLEAADVLASTLAPAFRRNDLRRASSASPSYTSAARLATLARVTAREMVPMRAMLYVGQPSSATDVSRFSLRALGRRGGPRVCDIGWLRSRGLSCG
jgi:hypothetical protein